MEETALLVLWDPPHLNVAGCPPGVAQRASRPSAFVCKLGVGGRSAVRFRPGSRGPGLTSLALLSRAAAPEPAGAAGGAALLPAAAGEGGGAHRGEEPAELGRHQHVPPVRDRAEHGGRGAGAGERAGAAPHPATPARGVPGGPWAGPDFGSPAVPLLPGAGCLSGSLCGSPGLLARAS